ncbi:LuxR C-terminal-related transcriptional regulator [Roseateles sp. SL47]|uniref:response regulator transcription factor n=1 Tax=Roseateles sp. SL47 TaxID=2995138 RepID=UPI00227174C1|nr:LuxR C-terminal-related transcriptional regulator [Roseateles sp. SL47]WAC70963.1 LuxR C-terminal-related transcriptional regulator [Roseateles sp. SL47]
MMELDLPPAATGDRCSTLELHGRRYTVLCVDGLTPRQQSRPGQARPRHVYHGAELVHFQLGDHRYVLVPEDSAGDAPASSAAMPDGDAAGERTGDLRRLLTHRELQIVQLICLGLLTKQVADRLHLSEFTVRSYLKTIYCKLGVRSRGAMVFAYASAFGVAPPAGLVEGA